jgi:hypothetical protein
VPESDAGLQYLEGKLNIFVKGPSQTRRNAALDLLIGRGPEHRVEPHAAVVDVAHPIASRTSTSPWLQSPSEPLGRRVRLVNTAPPQRSAWPTALAVLACAAIAAVVLVGTFPARGLFEQSSVAAPVVVADEAAQSVFDEPAQVIVDALAPVVVAEPVVQARPTTVLLPVAAAAVVPVSTVVVPAPSGEFRLLLDERFGSNVHAWPSNELGPAWLADGSYHLVPRDPGRFVAVSVPGTDGLQDVVLSADFRKLGGPAGGGYGLIVRDQTPAARDGHSQVGRFYVFEVGDRGDVGVWLRDQERWVDLLPWMASDAVHPGHEANQLTVSAVGDRLSFMVNGIAVASQQDTLLERGSLGVFAGGDGNEVELDRVSVRVSH